MNGEDDQLSPFDSSSSKVRKNLEAALMSPSMNSARSGLTSTQSASSTNPRYATSIDSFDADPRSLLDEATKKEHKRETKEKKAKDKKAKKKKKAKKEKKRSKNERISGDSHEGDAHLETASEETRSDYIEQTLPSRRLNNGSSARHDSANASLMTPSPNGMKKKKFFSTITKEQAKSENNGEQDPARAKELEAMGVPLQGEPEEDKMLRVAMEMSLKDFRVSLMSEPGPEIARSTSVPVQGTPDPDADVDLDSHRCIFSQATHEMTEVVVEDPRGQVKAQRRFSTRNLVPPSKSISESAMNDEELKLPARTSIGYPNDDPKSKFSDHDPKTEPEPSRRRDLPNYLCWTERDVQKKIFAKEFDEEMFSEFPLRPLERAGCQASLGALTRPVDQIRPIDQIRLARQNLSAQEADEIERALRDAGEDTDEQTTRCSPIRSGRPLQQCEPSPRSPNVPDLNTSENLSPEEAAEIARALLEADEEEARKSLQLALQLQSEEATLFSSQQQNRLRAQGNVRTMSPEAYAAEQAAQVGAVTVYGRPLTRHPLDETGDDGEEAGYRINSSRPSQNWARVRDHVVGPNNEVRTKHDAELQARSNSSRLGLDDDGFIGNAAYNSFRQSMQRRTVKGVAAHGHGRATSDTDKTKADAMDPRVRMLITRATNNRLIVKCNGIVREGNEAVIYHADQGEAGGGYDVAIKVFKHIKEVRGRGDYVDGEPRFDGKFRKASSREQLEMSAEKEYRNLLRANQSGVPVPTPLFQKENVVFMRFIGEGGWALPQLKDLKIRKGSDKWTALYSQIMVAIRRLFHGAQLVHGDLSEYNILVCPARLVENRDEGFGPSDDNELQSVLIDFGQAVDWRHPLAMELLDRDLTQVRDFFTKKCVKTLALNLAHEFVTAPEPNQGSKTTIGDDSKMRATAGMSGTANVAKNNSASFPAQASRDRASIESVESMRRTGDSRGNGADAFHADWSEFDKQG